MKSERERERKELVRERETKQCNMTGVKFPQSITEVRREKKMRERKSE